MIKNNKKFLLLFVLFIAVFSSCKLEAQDLTDYYIEYRVVSDKGSEFYKNVGLECIFYNFFPKTVESFQITFQLFDETGAPFNKGIVNVKGVVNHNEYTHFFLNLDEHVGNYTSPDKVRADFVYVNKIIFSDGTEYSDPYGLKYFMKKDYQ